MTKNTALKTCPNLCSLWREIFTSDRLVYKRSFYVFGVFASLLIFLSLVTFFLVFLTEPTSAPFDVRISNVTDSAITITWKTEIETKGLVTYLPSKTPQILRPLGLLSLPSNYREFDQIKGFSKIHSATITNLLSNTSYHYRISTGLHTYKVDNTGNLLPDLKTGPVLESINTPAPIYGRVIQNLETPASNSLVYLYLQKDDKPFSSLLSSVTNLNGYYLFDLSSLRTEDLQTGLEILPEERIKIEAINNNFATGQIEAGQINEEIPDLILK